MAAKRKSLVTAVVFSAATAIAALAGCSNGGDIKAKSASEEKKEQQKQEPAAVSGTAPVDLSGLTADQIADKAVATTRAARSLRMAGHVSSEGERTTVDLAMDNKGACTGKLGLVGTAELRQVNKILYMKADEKFWRASLNEGSSSDPGRERFVELVKDRWIKMPASSARDMGGVCDLKAMLEDRDMNKSDRQGMTKGPDAEVNGLPTTTLVKKKAGGETITLYVAKKGKPYLVRVVKTGGDAPGTMTFSDFDKPVKVVAPPADQVVDLEKLDTGLSAGPGSDSGAGSSSGSGFGFGLRRLTPVEAAPDARPGRLRPTGATAVSGPH
ncbi:hypothetical protein [Streptomyces sp. NPDC001820]|uniref:hypothetical protein n=1 Tax=Streptomyces sp. NPDC001820 TaxID=3364613 RepID=UPI003684BF07